MADGETPIAPPAEAPGPAPEPPPAKRRWRRIVLGTFAVLVAIIVGLLVSFLTVDLGPRLRKRAEVEGSNFMHRTMRIGELRAKLIPGVFVVRELVIEGLAPSDRPFLKAKEITVVVPWWTILTKQLMIESVEMTDWEMVVETWPASPGSPNGRHNFPKFTRDRPSTGPKRFTTTLKWVLASRGAFTYDDHGTPWSTAARDLRVSLSRTPIDTVYRGSASFGDSTITIQSYEPFRANMRSQFTIDGSLLRFSRMDLVSDGARSALTGTIDLGRWPEQTYQIRSNIDVPTQKDIFFHGQNFKASGRADFEGTFHLFKGGRELKGTFVSPLAGVFVGGRDWRFPNLRGAVLWLPDRLEITDATSGLLGGTARFDYRLAPFGRKDVPTTATWDVGYEHVDLARLTDFLETEGLRLAGRITGRNRLVWPLGKWSQKIGSGEVVAGAPAGMRLMTRELQPDVVAAEAALPPEAGPFNPRAPMGYLPIAGRIGYSLDPDWIAIDRSWTATEKSYVSFEGRTAYGQRSQMPFHVTSLDWQESDRVLAGIMTAFGAPTGAIPIGGHGEFDGVMLEAFSKPRIEGQFTGNRMRAWDVDWGHARAKLIIQNGYVDISESTITRDGSEIVADGRFSLGYPRKDGGEEFNTRVRITRRPLVDLRHAFNIDDYPVEGVLSGNFHVYGLYEGPDGFGQMTIDRGAAYGESFEKAAADLRFEGNGVRLNAIDLRKGAGSVTGAAWVGWDGNYSFSADGTKIPVESLALATFKRAPLSGVLQFKASGTGTFEQPRYDVNVRVDDLFAADEGIGQLSGQLGLRGDLLTLTFNVASQRLQATGSGRIGLTDQMDADLTLQFRDTSLDPYIRFFEPRLSPFTNAVAEGTVRVFGELANLDHLVVDAQVERLDLKLFDYSLRNEEPFKLSLDQRVVRLTGNRPDGRARLVGIDTQLELGGSIDLKESRVGIDASGDANLGILQGFFRDLRSSGAATLRAQINGPLDKPVFSGSATIANGRFRASTLPSLDAINGNVSFDATGIRLDDLEARLGAGDVTIGGRIVLTGFNVGGVNLTARGERMTLRYPEGFRSIVDADLSLRGDLTGLDLTGLVTVHDAAYTRRVEPNPDIFNFSGSGSTTPPAATAPPALPVRFNIGVRAQQSLRIDNNLGRIWSSADLTLTGTYERPVLLGRADIDRGDLTLLGNRYSVTRGSIDFVNLAKIEPYFDIEAETRVRIPGQIYRVTIGINGTVSTPSFSFNSDPPLPAVDILSLLLGQTSDPRGLQNAELRTLSATEAARSETELLKTAGIQLLGGRLSGPLARAVEQTLGLSSVQILPSFGPEGAVLTPSARLVIGQRISNRAYLTIAQAVGGTAREQIVILEYDHNDRLSWVFTQTKYDTNTFSLEFRLRHVFF